MERYPAQPGYELVLDSRRLIIACALVIFVCGVFFILGFVEGKRQILQVSQVERTSPPVSTAETRIPGKDAGTPQPVPAVPDARAKPSTDQQGWYDNVNAQGQQAQLQPRSGPAPKPATSPVSSKPPAASPAPAAKPAAGAFYSCQVGAFRQKKEADIKAEELNTRGFASVIEAPVSAGGLFLLKVGRFPTRAEAVAMQNRLKKAGYSCFIKTSR